MRCLMDLLAFLALMEFRTIVKRIADEAWAQRRPEIEAPAAVVADAVPFDASKEEKVSDAASACRSGSTGLMRERLWWRLAAGMAATGPRAGSMPGLDRPDIAWHRAMALRRDRPCYRPLVDGPGVVKRRPHRMICLALMSARGRADGFARMPRHVAADAGRMRPSSRSGRT